MWFESKAKSMRQIKRLNDLNQDQRTKKNWTYGLSQAFRDLSQENFLFDSYTQNKNPKTTIYAWFELSTLWFESNLSNWIMDCCDSNHTNISKSCFFELCLIRVKISMIQIMTSHKKFLASMYLWIESCKLVIRITLLEA